MVEAWRSGGVPLLDSTGLARVFITSLLLFAIAICLLNSCNFCLLVMNAPSSSFRGTLFLSRFPLQVRQLPR